MKKNEQLVISARNGDKKALSQLLENIREPVFQLAIRMLGFPSDAEDATQEILIKVMTNLAGFRQKSKFKTWVYRISLHHLLNVKRKYADKYNINFQSWEDYIHVDRGDVRLNDRNNQEKALLINEVRTGCVQGLLLCLDKDVRAAFLLGEIFEFTSKDGAWILGITPEAFRKRLSRGRKKIKAFMVKNCGFLNDSNPCRCREQAERDINTGMIDPDHLYFKDPKIKNLPSLDMGKTLSELDDIGKMITLFKTYPRYSSPDSTAGMMKELIHSQNFSLFQ
ncbi:MAG: RNA polymerase sigma factor [Desulfobacteraceae bacterium]|nr:RNA polymerase sigma factor [Desulfobacteraceae bacterium]